MRCRLLALTIALAAGAAIAQEGNPLHSAECRNALDTLQAQEAAAAASSPAGQQPQGRERSAHPRLEAARRHAATVCLGSRADAPPPAGRLAQPPVGVAPIAVVPAPPPRLPPAPAVQLPRVAPPAVVTACDPAGCWASDGTRLQRVGPNLFGPRGFCTVQGSIVHCP